MPILINSGLRPDYGTFTDGHSYSSSCLERESELIRQSEARFNARLTVGLVGFTEMCREAGIPAEDIVKLRRALGNRRQRHVVIKMLTFCLPSDIACRSESVLMFADAWGREVGVGRRVQPVLLAAE